jgi:cobalamin biosynthesis Mg chelatase CobN
MKQPFNRILAIFLLLLFVFINILMFTSCGSKKIAKEETKSKSKKVTIGSNALHEMYKDDIVVAQNESEASVSESVTFEGKPGDTLKVTNKGANGEILSQVIYSGNGKVTTDKSKSNKQKSKKYNQKQHNEASGASTTAVTDFQEKESKKTDISRSSSWFLFPWWLLFLIAVVCVWYLYKKLKSK